MCYWKTGTIVHPHKTGLDSFGFASLYENNQGLILLFQYLKYGYTSHLIKSYSRIHISGDIIHKDYF